MLLIDGDILCYPAAAYYQEVIQWDDDEEPDTIAFFPFMQKMVKDRIESYKDTLVDSEITVVFSDKQNFRKTLMPTYKANRSDVVRPIMLARLIAWVEDHYPSITWPNLEADDTLGILCTRNPTWIVVTTDKDQNVVPGLWYNPNKPELGVRCITEKQANRNHLIQTMTGDSTDGYKGAKGIGPKKAEKIMDYAETQFLDPWLEVVDAFESKGQTKEDALLNARMARILRDGDYIEETGEVIEWEPTTLNHYGAA